VDSTVSPVSPTQATQHVRLDLHVRPDAVATELPSTKSVQSAWTSEPVENRISSHAAIAGRLAATFKTSEQRFERDPDTATLVFKRIDPTSGEVIMQLPTQSVLDLRAYLKQQETSSQAEASLSKTA